MVYASRMEEARLLTSLRAYFDTGATRSEEWRREQLNKLREVLEERRTEIEAALYEDLHKSVFDSEVTEIGVTISEIRHALGSLRRWMRPRRVATPALLQPASSCVRSEPLGVVLIISPWNYPVNLLLSPLVGALAAGNCAVLKPSELAPATSRTLARLLNQAFAPEVLRVIEGGKEETSRLLALPFDHIFYTGSTAVGRVVMEAAAKNLVPVTLELGGKSPCLVLPDADLEISARRIAWGKWFNAGQTCVAPDYLYVHESIKEPFLKALEGAVREQLGKDPISSSNYGRIVNDRHFKRLLDLLPATDAPANHGRVLFGGQSKADERYLAPTVIDNATWDAPVMRDEIFGPILPVLSFTDLNATLGEIRSRPRPLALYVFTSNTEHERRVFDGLSFGGGCVNDTIVHLGNVNLPFGGVGASGMGSYHGDKSFATFSHEKSELRRSLAFDLKLRYPPHTEAKLSLVRKLREIFG